MYDYTTSMRSGREHTGYAVLHSLKTPVNRDSGARSFIWPTVVMGAQLCFRNWVAYPE